MSPLNFLNLLALASIAIVALSSGPAPVNALVADRAQVARHVHARDAIARRRRRDDTNGRCKPRPSDTTTTTTTTTPPPATSTSPSATSTPPPTSSTPPPTSSTSPPASASSAPSSAAISGSSNTNSKKMGLAWGEDAPLKNFLLPSVGWVYNWSPDPPYDWTPDSPYYFDTNALPFFPMFWGIDKLGNFTQEAESNRFTTLLAQNEPNEPSQSNVDPQTGFAQFMQYIAPYAGDHTIVSPAVTNDAAGFEWLTQFYNLCDANPNCRVDKTAMHAYTTDADAAIQFATQLHGAFNRPVWITEFACQDFSGGPQADMDQIWDFAGTMRQFIQDTEWLEKAAPFGALSDLQGVNPLNSLLDGSGNPTPLGYFYFG